MIKLYLNENVPKSIGEGLALRGFDVKETFEAGNSGATDKEQLDYASRDGRSIFTFNVGDFSKLHLEYLSGGINHKGIILSKHRPVGVIVKALSRIVMMKNMSEIENQIVWLSEYL